jgi:putative transposase
MARLPRLVVPHHPHHVIQRGNDRQLIFREPADYEAFRSWLAVAAERFKVAIHAYALMPNHLHLLATPSDSTGLARMMQWVGRYYVPYFNAKFNRTGTLWQGRFRTSVVESERYFMVCSRYIELNPVRAGMVGDPADYLWSSYGHHVGIRSDPLIADHPLYWQLGNTPFAREAAYRQLVAQGLSQPELEAVRGAVQKGSALGAASFMRLLEGQVARRVLPGKRGRPRKELAVPASEP